MNVLLTSCLMVGLIISCQAASVCGFDHKPQEQSQSLENLYDMWQMQKLARAPYDHQLIRKSSAGPLRLRFGKRTLGDRVSVAAGAGGSDTGPPYDHQLIRKSSAGPLRLRFGKRTLGDRLADLLAERRVADAYGTDDLPKTV